MRFLWTHIKSPTPENHQFAHIPPPFYHQDAHAWVGCLLSYFHYSVYLLFFSLFSPNIAREILKLLDFDGSGTVKTSDLHKAFMGTGLSEADVNDFIRKHDKGNKGEINLEELTAMLNTVHRKTSRVTMSGRSI